ncbi:hypothetical protein PZ739_06065 [Pseudomonas kermanshahensis]|uniref:hypothetical protein n=1 Tax=Pseudomonas kermanshahensis TaxID=2745482 RepID=UPI0023DC13CD|nr:hypothetical protein [Pseudomonas kermanshahensis]WEL56732.1 hypothetical protein PZ739_06065 [Pseudomonas kermanshahensis]
MRIYAHAHAHTRIKNGAQALILRGFGAIFCSYSNTIGVCAERSDIQGLTAGDLVGDGKTGNGTGFFIQMQAAAVGHVRAVRRAIMELRP